MRYCVPIFIFISILCLVGSIIGIVFFVPKYKFNDPLLIHPWYISLEFGLLLSTVAGSCFCLICLIYATWTGSNEIDVENPYISL